MLGHQSRLNTLYGFVYVFVATRVCFVVHEEAYVHVIIANNFKLYTSYITSQNEGKDAFKNKNQEERLNFLHSYTSSPTFFLGLVSPKTEKQSRSEQNLKFLFHID